MEKDLKPRLERREDGLHFVCSCCGACCSHLEVFGGLYADLDDGRGVCRHYDAKTHLCSCYASRPLKCRIEEGYAAYFVQHCSYEEYLQLTAEACLKLQQLPDKNQQH